MWKQRLIAALSPIGAPCGATNIVGVL